MSVSRKFLIALVLGLATAADAATFTVTNTTASGAGSLHQAILDANADDTADVIEFAIAGFGIKTIAGNLPAITQPVTIDGYSQPLTSVNTLGGSETDANLRIVLSGAALGSTENVLDIQKGPTTVRGVVIRGIPAKGAGIAVAAGATGVAVKGCFIGTNASGTADDSLGSGVIVDGTATIGTGAPADRNLISGTDGAGILLRGADSVVQNNLIGLAASGAPTIANGIGVRMATASATGNLIGGTGKGAANEIAGNEGAGIALSDTAGGGNRFEGNRIHSNGELGIDLGDDGVTFNDDGDVDSGPNGLQNFPEIAHARLNGSILHVEGVLFGAPGQYRIEIFSNDEVDPGGFGEGGLLRDSLLVFIPGGEEGVAFVNETNLNEVPSGPLFVSATAASVTDLETSEFSRAVEAFVGGTEIVVTNTNDSGPGSLRTAINTANGTAEPNTIVFSIPGAGPHTIATSSELTVNEDPIIIDGYSQPGSTLNTASVGTNAQLKVEIDGGDDVVATLNVARTSGQVRGLGIRSGGGQGIRLIDVDGVQVEGCFVGTDIAGEVDAGHVKDGINTGDSVNVTVGGFSRANRNLISGNEFRGILDVATGSHILNNLVGTDATGSGSIGNNSDGIHASGSGARIGSDEPGVGNRVRGNARNGIDIPNDSQGVTVLGNDIADNQELGIDLVNASFDLGVTANDVDDADDETAGANSLQNFPKLTGAMTASGKVLVSGSLDVPVARLDSVYRLRFFRSTECDDSKHGEGEQFLTALDVLIPNDEEFTLEFPATVAVGEFLTATATDPESGNTSEFSACRAVAGGEPAPLCGDGSLNGSLAAGDALITLQTAVGSNSCDLCVCDVNGNGEVQSSDALSVLRKAVGQNVTLDCPVCD